MKKLIALFSVIAVMLALAQCTAPESELTEGSVISKLNLPSDSEIKLYCGETAPKSFFTVSADGNFSAEDIDFISEDEDIAQVKYDSVGLTRYIYYTVEGIAPGETYINFKVKNSSVTSDKIKVTVESKEKPEETTEPPVTEPPITEPPATEPPATEPPATEPPVTEPPATKPPAKPAGTNQSPAQEYGSTVYITPTGKKYHYSKACAGKNAIATDISSASATYGPCKKCVG